MPQRKKRRSAPATGPVAAKSGQRSPSPPSTRDWKRVTLIGGGGLAAAALVFFIATGVAGEIFGAPEGVVAVPVGEARHVEGEIEYDGHPAGGEHSSIWLNCGVYDQPVAEENAVHSLEHGAVWITYEAGDTNVDVGRLNRYAGRNKVIVSPVLEQESPVFVTAWANQMEASEADDPRINQFIVEFAGAASAPEPGGRCTGGVGQPG